MKKREADALKAEAHDLLTTPARNVRINSDGSRTIFGDDPKTATLITTQDDDGQHRVAFTDAGEIIETFNESESADDIAIKINDYLGISR